ncbi:hypothetical protein THASP1DRAFT_21470 [Thamnocephalis sphaerospora]|uniref:Uncharacterized protein n=1 Tax=Thamnocephalis sphaerospora TaxID=78915 RepID=A0A4P9XYS5_9FUNG|nr:hypothetical protein THASP1DRAFT_21470 [Thamnocephalis sphaerospora]|eukprot:RKP10861.1 hypothetical protein THASP1DRAFT_21470 [Thamnocephalis sphaerospora]
MLLPAPTHWLADRQSRRTSLYLTGSTFIVNAVLQSTAGAMGTTLRILMKNRLALAYPAFVCKASLDVESMMVERTLSSDEYLVIGIKSKGNQRHFLYFWHFSALHKPPRLITDIRVISMDMRDNWLVGQYQWHAQVGGQVTFVYNLANATCYRDIVHGQHNICIQRATADSLHIISVGHTGITRGSNLVTCQLWEVVPDRPAPFRRVAEAKTTMILGEYLQPQRVDDSSGLYPLDDQWKKMGNNKIWWDPRRDAQLKVYTDDRQTSSTTATLYRTVNSFLVIDYTGD